MLEPHSLHLSSVFLPPSPAQSTSSISHNFVLIDGEEITSTKPNQHHRRLIYTLTSLVYDSVLQASHHQLLPQSRSDPAWGSSLNTLPPGYNFHFLHSTTYTSILIRTVFSLPSTCSTRHHQSLIEPFAFRYVPQHRGLWRLSARTCQSVFTVL
jgi:hypothetical protein